MYVVLVSICFAGMVARWHLTRATCSYWFFIYFTLRRRRLALKKILRDLQPIFGAKSAVFIETRANKQKQRARNVPLASADVHREDDCVTSPKWLQ